MYFYSIMSYIPDDIQQFNWKSMLIDGGLVLVKIFIIYIMYLLIRAATNKVLQTSFLKILKQGKVSPGRALTLESLIKNTLNYVLVFVLIVTILQLLGIKATAILAGAGVVGLAVGFGAQGLVSDVVTGFFLLLEKQLDVGDHVTIGIYSGTVEQLGLKTTIIRGQDGTLHYLPNRKIDSLSNHSRGDMRAMIDICVDAEKDLNPVLALIQEACDEVAVLQPMDIIEGPNVLGVQDFDGSTVTIRVLARTINGSQSTVERVLRRQVKEKMEVQGERARLQA